MFYLAMFSCHPISQHLSTRVPRVPCSACSEHRPWTLRTESGQGAGMWQKRKGGGAERLCREVAGREVAADKEQGRPGGMVLTDPRAPGVGTLWLRAGYSLVSQLGVSSRVPLSTFFQETSLCFVLVFFPAPSHDYLLSFRFPLLGYGVSSPFFYCFSSSNTPPKAGFLNSE